MRRWKKGNNRKKAFWTSCGESFNICMVNRIMDFLMRLQDKSEHVAHNILHNSVVKVKCRGGLKRGSGWGRGLESPKPPHGEPPQRNHKHEVVLTQVQAWRCVHKHQKSDGERGWREEGWVTPCGWRSTCFYSIINYSQYFCILTPTFTCIMMCGFSV